MERFPVLIPLSLAKFMQRRVFREFLAYYKVKENEDKKGDKALGNEQGLRQVGSKTMLCARVVCGID